MNKAPASKKKSLNLHVVLLSLRPSGLICIMYFRCGLICIMYFRCGLICIMYFRCGLYVLCTSVVVVVWRCSSLLFLFVAKSSF